MERPSRPETEKILRKAGFSSRQAKRLLSGGWACCVGEEAAKKDELLELLEQVKENLTANK